jgi:tRNA-splicing ligase RtcB
MGRGESKNPTELTLDQEVARQAALGAVDPAAEVEEDARKASSSPNFELTKKEMADIRHAALTGGEGTMVIDSEPYREFDDGNLKVWGYTYDTNAVKQLRTVASYGWVKRAALMGDGHLGYSMPIGGVVAYREMVSPSGVGYDIGCFAAGTKVTTDHGYYLPIEQISASDPAICWDGNKTRLISDHIGAVARGKKKTIEMVFADGRSLRLTPEHLLRTPDGWKEAQDLTESYYVAASPFVGLPYEEPSDEAFELELSEFAVKDLEARGLWPLRPSDEFFPIILRLLAYASGDGHIPLKGNRIDFYTSCMDDALAIQADLALLGFYSGMNTRQRQPHHKPSTNLYVYSVALVELFAALGSPKGKKAWTNEPMSWLFDLPAWQRAHFLSSFCAAEMTTPRLTDGGCQPNLQLKQASEIGEDHMINLVGRLFESLGYSVSIAPSGIVRNTREDMVLQILGGEAEQLRFMKEIGFVYSTEKREAAAKIFSVSLQRLGHIANRVEAWEMSHSLRGQGLMQKEVVAAVTSEYEVSPSFVLHTLNGRNTPRAAKGARFEPYSDGEIYWSPVSRIEESVECEVFDVATSDDDHSFLAEGFSVHNCGVHAVRTNVKFSDLGKDVERIADEMASQISFGLGRKNNTPIDHPLFDSPTWQDVPYLTQQIKTKHGSHSLLDRAREQLGTTGSGNHYCLLLVEPETDELWVACHFGSRGLGHGIASGFLHLAQGNPFSTQAPSGESMHALPTLLPLTEAAAKELKSADPAHAVELGLQYRAAMELGGEFAYAGREYVANQVLAILGAENTFDVHNHHNYSFQEEIDGEMCEVARKGATPAYPGQTGFIGGSMGDISVVVEGVDTEEANKALNSTVHGAGRVMSRSRAKGNRKGTKAGEISPEQMFGALNAFRKESGYPLALRGGDVDESPFVYRQLDSVLDAHVKTNTIKVAHRLMPVVVCMAPSNVIDPFKD